MPDDSNALQPFPGGLSHSCSQNLKSHSDLPLVYDRTSWLPIGTYRYIYKEIMTLNMSIIYTFMYFSCKPKEMSIQTQIYIVNALLTGTLDLRRLQPRIPEESSPPWLLLPCNPPACLWRNGSRQMEWKMSDPGKESEMEATTYVIGWDLPDWFDAQQFAPNGTPVSDPKGTKPCARQVRRQQLLSWSSIPESTITSLLLFALTWRSGGGAGGPGLWLFSCCNCCCSL